MKLYVVDAFTTRKFSGNQAGVALLGRDEELFTDTLVAERVNWISVPGLDAPMEVTAKTRYSHSEAAATVEELADGRIRVRFERPQRAITAGQAVVLYDGEKVVGGGTIV